MSRTESVMPAASVLVFLLAVVGLVGLVVAAQFPADGGYWAGLGIFGLALAGLFLVLKRHFDRLDHDPALPKQPRFAEQSEMVMPPVPTVAAYVTTRGSDLPPAVAPARGGGFLPGAWLRAAVLLIVALGSLFVAAGSSGFFATVAIVVFVLAVLGLFQQLGGGAAEAGQAGGWLAGAAAAVLVLAGLVAAAHGEKVVGDLGLIVAVAAVAYIFLLIKDAYDRPAA